MVLTDEQKRIKNEKAKERRLKLKMEKAQSELVILEANKIPEPEIIEITEDPDEVLKRKLEIAEKRRQTLQKARSMRVSPSQIRKNNEEEMMRMKEEREREMMMKQEEMMIMKEENEKLKTIAEEKQKIKKVIKYVPVQPMMPQYQQPIQQPIQQAPDPTIEYLAEQSYAEQLQKKIRQSMLDRVMMQTFM
jgi:hypothetical protein